MHLSTDHLKTHLAAARQSLFYDRAAVDTPLVTLHACSREVDDALKKVYRQRIDEHGPDSGYCLVALGGYGRQELWPYSDIDILILHAGEKKADKLSALIKDFWSLGLPISSVVRTPEECRAILGEDVATDTALLEARYLSGNHRMFESLQNDSLRPYFEKNKKAYIDEMSAALREGLFSSENSLYRIEPDLKNGICTLRDCQRLLWAERVRNGCTSLAELHPKSGFSLSETRRLEAGYAFLAGLRSALHMAAGQRLDILETPYHQAIADRLGLGRHQAGELLEIFFKRVRDIRLSLLSFLEKDLSGKSIWRNVRRRMSSVEVVPGLVLLDGILFPQSKKNLQLEHPEDVLAIFKQALVCQGTLSVELRNTLRHRLEHMTADDFRSRKASDMFLSVLSWPGPVGQTLLLMHETGLLSRMLPAFAGLTCKVEYDQYHEFTVDQHTLLALCACDELADDVDMKIRTIHQAINNQQILRLAVLLHDIGKAMPGDHVQTGAVIAETMGERLGLPDNRIVQIRFLVAHHLDMSNLSLLRDFDDHNLLPFALSVGNLETLNLLYLLTVVDIRSVGHNTWTGWKAYQLEQLYDRTVKLLATLRDQQGAKPATGASELSGFQGEAVIEEFTGHDLCQRDLHAEGIGFVHELYTGFERLVVCAEDRVGFLSDFIGCLTSEGYNILSAKIRSTADGVVYDTFYLEPPEKPRLTAQKRLENIRNKWHLLKAGRVDADKLVEERMKRYPLPVLRRNVPESPVEVRVDNQDAATATIVEIDTADNFGLLHKIAHTFFENGINIVAAKLSTRNDQACDVFYVTDGQKNKITDEKMILRLIDRLKTRLHHSAKAL